jgi:ethanolamine permease
VISGEYFGWSYGWASAGTLGFVITALFVAAMYHHLHLQLHRADHVDPARGRPVRVCAPRIRPDRRLSRSAATLVEFVFAPPAIALAIGAYLHVQFPGLEPKHAAMGAYLVFMALNIVGVQIAATFELVVTRLSSCWCSWASCRRASRGATS